MSGSETSYTSEVEVIGLGELDALRRGAGRQHLEFVVQNELIFKGLAKLLVVVDDENPAGSAHAGWLR